MTATSDVIESLFRWVHPDVSDWASFVDWLDRTSDPRVQGWPLLDSFLPTMYMTAAYLAFVILGSWVMRSVATPFDLKPLMVLYNMVVIALNVYMLQGFLVEAYRADYGLICNPIDLSPKGLPVAWYVYVYYLSKVLDFSDTVFIILRKKFDQLSFLHVYHHSFMFWIWWIGSKYGNGGDAIFGPMCNAFIHTVMYTYYLAAALKVHIPGKKYLTQMQMIQFFVVVTHSILNVALGCPFPHRLQIAQIIFLCTLFALFLNFYRKAYQPRHGKRAGRVGTSSTDATSAPTSTSPTDASAAATSGAAQKRSRSGVKEQ